MQQIFTEDLLYVPGTAISSGQSVMNKTDMVPALMDLAV